MFEESAQYSPSARPGRSREDPHEMKAYLRRIPQLLHKSCFTPYLSMSESPDWLIILASTLLGLIAAQATEQLICRMGPIFVKAGLTGIDLNKRTTLRDSDGSIINGVPLPEAMGLASGICCVTSWVCLLPVCVWVHRYSGEHRLMDYLAFILTNLAMLFLGFVDNVLTMKWRWKLVFPGLAIIPLVLVYFTNGAPTGVQLPFFFQGTTLDLGWVYYLCIVLICVFSTNAINIYAGVNGLEVGQSLVLGLLVVGNSSYQLITSTCPHHRANHWFTLSVILPFILTCVSLFHANFYPAKVFVGDSFCYFSGMVLASTSILGQFPKTLAFLLLPQILNFLISLPQLLLFPSPRHRMPGFSSKTGQLVNSWFSLSISEVTRWQWKILSLFHRMRVIDIDEQKDTLKITNFTLINTFLVNVGPTNEARVCLSLMLLQLMTGFFGFTVRAFLTVVCYP